MHRADVDAQVTILTRLFGWLPT